MNLQGSKGDTDTKNRLLDSVEEAKSGMIWEKSTETCTLPYVKQITSASLMHEAGAPGQPRRMRWGGRWMGVQDKADAYVPAAGSCWCMAKTFTTL